MKMVSSRLIPGGFFIGTILDEEILSTRLRAASQGSNELAFGNEYYRVMF